MTKKEQAAYDALQKELEVRSAFRWYDPVPADVPPPTAFREFSKGWIAHFSLDGFARGASVDKASSSTVSHYRGERSWSDNPVNGSQNPIYLWSSPAAAVRHQQALACRRFAEQMAELNRQIARLEADAKESNA